MNSIDLSPSTRRKTTNIASTFRLHSLSHTNIASTFRLQSLYVLIDLQQSKYSRNNSTHILRNESTNKNQNLTKE